MYRSGSFSAAMEDEQSISKLRQWREGQRLSQAEAGDKVGVSAVAWGRYERGRVPEPEVLQKIITVTQGAVTANDWFDIPREKAA
jgi:transcriptional regulator with XRE-family HTH domain